MAPSPITEDYYMILEVEPTAEPQLIAKSYRRLALKLHPDRNDKRDATEAFQRLGRAYETLKDEVKRRADDLIYPSLKTRCPQIPCPTSRPEAFSEAAQLAAIQKSRQERSTRWRTQKNALDSSIFDLQRRVRQLEQEIRNLDSILVAEMAAEAQKNSWGTWLLLPFYNKVEETASEKARKDRERQERRIEKDLKERWLESKKAELKSEETRLRTAKEDVDAADLRDDEKLRAIQAKIRAREDREWRERLMAEKEKFAHIRRQQEEQRKKQEQEAAEAVRKQNLERREAQRQYEEANRRRQKIVDDEAARRRERYMHFEYMGGDTRTTSTSNCRHGGWWPKIQGSTACPRCYEWWTYLLQCPGCGIKACPRCQASIRPA
ncbi:DnaJ-domain-containing protein [Cladophialophora carrionii]|uniref:DnaJ-domain-containing protein n=1 Tax=Cladophialophora carrionii TaxID=86049 RepID=A0A1C1CJ44_9EURO|nr:DnaJ-domain-containing protein [Cladophialophora carrionii]